MKRQEYIVVPQRQSSTRNGGDSRPLKNKSLIGMQASLRLSQRKSLTKAPASSVTITDENAQKTADRPETAKKQPQQIKLSKSQIKQSVLQSLRDQAAEFDFKVFQNLNEAQHGENDLSHFSIFQRFCVMLLVINGGSDAQESNEFLKGLNVYNEIKLIDQRIKEKHGTYDTKRIKILRRQDDSNQLQRFINTVIEYAESLDQGP